MSCGVREEGGETAAWLRVQLVDGGMCASAVEQLCRLLCNECLTTGVFPASCLCTIADCHLLSCAHCTWCRHAGQAVTEAELTEAGAAAASGGGSGSPRGSNGSSCGWTEGEGGKDAKGVWKILWRGGGYQQQLSFEATQTT